MTFNDYRRFYWLVDLEFLLVLLALELLLSPDLAEALSLVLSISDWFEPDLIDVSAATMVSEATISFCESCDCKIHGFFCFKGVFGLGRSR